MNLAAIDQWTTEHIALFLGLTRKYVTNRVTKQKDFPKPVINHSRRNRKWDANQVRVWAKGAAA